MDKCPGEKPFPPMSGHEGPCEKLDEAIPKTDNVMHFYDPATSHLDSASQSQNVERYLPVTGYVNKSFERSESDPSSLYFTPAQSNNVSLNSSHYGEAMCHTPVSHTSNHPNGSRIPGRYGGVHEKAKSPESTDLSGSEADMGITYAMELRRKSNQLFVSPSSIPTLAVPQIQNEGSDHVMTQMSTPHSDYLGVTPEQAGMAENEVTQFFEYPARPEFPRAVPVTNSTQTQQIDLDTLAAKLNACHNGPKQRKTSAWKKLKTVINATSTPQETNSSSVHESGTRENSLDSSDYVGNTSCSQSHPTQVSFHQMQLEDRNTCSTQQRNPEESFLKNFCGNKSRMRKFGGRNRIIIASCAFLSVLVGLVIILFPVSYVALNYDKYALLRSRVTGYMDLQTTYYTGCYLLGPDKEFLEFPAVAHREIFVDMSIFTKDRLSLGIDVHIYYYLRPTELGMLYEKLATEYAGVFRRSMQSCAKVALTEYSLDQLRLERSRVAANLHQIIKEKMSTMHVDIRYLYIGDINIPDDVSQRMLTRTLLEEKHEEEILKQQHALTEKDTELLVQRILNQAEETLQKSHADGSLIKTIAEADAEAMDHNATMFGLRHMYDRLSIATQQYRLSLYLLHVYRQSDNVFFTNGYAKRSLWAP